MDRPIPDAVVVDQVLLDGVLLVADAMNIPVDELHGTERLPLLRAEHPDPVSPVSDYAPMKRAREWLLGVLSASTGVAHGELDRLAPTVPRQMRMGFDIAFPLTVLAARAGWEPQWVPAALAAGLEFAEADRVLREPGGMEQVRLLSALRGRVDPWAGPAR